MRHVWRENAYRMPWLYAVQQSALVELRARRRRVHEPEFTLLQNLGLPADPICLDVGANRGQSIVSFKAVLPDAEVMSFEPEPKSYKAAVRVAARFNRVSVHPFGLGAKAATLTLSVPHCRGLRFPQLASTHRDPERVAAILQDWARFGTPDTVTFDDTQIEIQTLDSLNLKPDVVKIDVEGGEVEVLLGGWDTIQRHHPIMMIEPNDDAFSFLMGMGYKHIGGGDALTVFR